MAREGDRVTVVALRGDAGFVRRVTELGLNVGADLVVSQVEGARIVLLRGDMRLGLGAGAAHRIMVTPAT
jgi:Fe2+ transport system protein FeoA